MKGVPCGMSKKQRGPAIPAAGAICLLLFLFLFSTCFPTAALESSLLYQGLENGQTFSAETASVTETNFAVNLNQNFTLSAVVRTNSDTGVQVLFAKGPKTAGHYELWLHEGILAFYAPDINGGTAIYTEAFVADGQEHHVAFTYDGSVWHAYLDGEETGTGQTAGTLQDTTETLVMGSLIDGEYKYIGYLAKVQIYGTALSTAQIQELLAAAQPTVPNTHTGDGRIAVGCMLSVICCGQCIFILKRYFHINKHSAASGI